MILKKLIYLLPHPRAWGSALGAQGSECGLEAERKARGNDS